MNIARTGVIAIATVAMAATAGLSPAMATTIRELQTQWAIANYELSDDEKEGALEKLAMRADSFTAEQPDNADGWIWSGIIKSSYAGARGGLGALSLAKAARRDLETGMNLDAKALNGSAYTSLGTLYFSVPGWPIGFGNDKKAEELLRMALEINPDGIDSNYFFAEFMRDQGAWTEARRYYLRAKAAPPRPDRPLADKGRHREIDAALEALQSRMND